MNALQTRYKVIGLYKELLRLGRDYPNPSYQFTSKVQRAFRSSTSLTDPKAINDKIALAEHVRNETLALISLAKYRYLRRTYSNPIEDQFKDIKFD